LNNILQSICICAKYGYRGRSRVLYQWGLNFVLGSRCAVCMAVEGVCMRYACMCDRDVLGQGWGQGVEARAGIGRASVHV
jgi:hypothetical protein